MRGRLVAAAGEGAAKLLYAAYPERRGHEGARSCARGRGLIVLPASGSVTEGTTRGGYREVCAVKYFNGRDQVSNTALDDAASRSRTLALLVAIVWSRFCRTSPCGPGQ